MYCFKNSCAQGLKKSDTHKTRLQIFLDPIAQSLSGGTKIVFLLLSFPLTSLKNVLIEVSDVRILNDLPP